MSRTTFKRIIKSGHLIFRRNGWLSTATVLVISMALFVAGGLILTGTLTATVIESIESKVDISIYFLPDAPEDKIFALKKELEALRDVAGVEYISREEALSRFRGEHQSNALIISALEELGENPLQASLNIQARDTSQYSSISDWILKKNYPVVDKVNYFENQFVIDRLGAIFNSVRVGGTALALFLTFLAVLIAFNTVRLAIFTLREEIRTMRLVGATTWFISGPFLVSGVIYGGLAATITSLGFFPLTWIAAPKLLEVVPNFDLFRYFLDNFWEFWGIMLFIGITLGLVSSFIALRRYLRV